jgi:hypothetical protein
MEDFAETSTPEAFRTSAIRSLIWFFGAIFRNNPDRVAIIEWRILSRLAELTWLD